MKLLELVVGIVLIWFVLRTIQQGQAVRVRETRKAAPPPSAAAPKASETTRCARCGVYVPADHATACQRADCPFPAAPEARDPAAIRA